jgi:hypothetical protein
MDFIDFVTSLAPEGETVLFVQQKTKAWIPQLPSAPRAEGKAWYVSSGSFILDRMAGGLSASAANCTHVTFLAVDDVNTKSKTPPLPPTWIIETSPGNYQWAWVLSEQVPLGVAGAAERAFAEAGYTDGGAISPVRNWRIPGSVNLKPERNRFAAVLTEFHPEREFTVEEVCAALGVTPAAANTATVRPVTLDDDGTDDVLAWLSESGHLTAQGNSAGWWGVVCPNNEAHTTGEIEGRYMPVNRAYTCLHEHCLEWDSVAFLTWVAEQGGPQHAPGLRSELLAPVMQAALAKLKPGDLFSEATDAGAMIAAVERKEIGRTEKAAWYGRFAYIQSDEAFFDMQERHHLPRTVFNALFRHIPCYSIHTDAKGKSRRVEASICYDENRQAMGAPALVGVTYSAGDDVLVARDGDVYGNMWRDARPPVNRSHVADISLWLDHCAALIPVEAEREHIYDVMACKLQNPRVKVNHAILIAGYQGSGKDTFWAPFLWAVCGDGRNKGELNNTTMQSQWGYAYESEVIILNELRESEAKERRALANHLKGIIAAPPNMIVVNKKMQHPYNVVNRCLVIASSNDRVPLVLDTQDRRWFCVWSDLPRMSTERGAQMWRWFESGGYEAIAAWLYRRDVSAFNPAATPMVTEYKLSLIANGQSPAESVLCQMIRDREGPFESGVISAPFHVLCADLTLRAGLAPGQRIPAPALHHALLECRWLDCGRVASAELPSRRHVYCAPELIHASKSELRRLVELPVGSPLADALKKTPLASVK